MAPSVPSTRGRQLSPGASLAGKDPRRSNGLPADDWTGRRVTIMGLGRHGGGLSAACYLAQLGAQVTISDAADGDSLSESLEPLRDVPIATLKLGGHDEADFRSAEFVVVNPAVRREHPCLQIARQSGATLTSEIELFLRRCPAAVIGVTGSNGKSTTCSMLAAMFAADGRRAWLGGNIGKSLLGEVNQIAADDWVVLELSSFQLAHLSDQAPLPQIAVVTNCTPNHLDWHGHLDDYHWAKQRIVREQSPAGLAVLNPHDAQVAAWSSLASGRTRAAWPLEEIPVVAVPGVHNRHNAACAAAAAEAAGVGKTAISRALRDFRGLDHRIQFVAEVAGRRFYNDSKSTTPQATIAALAALDGPIWLLAGGHPKDARFEELARAVVPRTRGAGLFGQARESLHACLQAQRAGFNALATEQLADALDWCWRQSQAGDIILLSPACASYDQFRDFEARGETYCRWVAELRWRAGK